MKRNESIIPLIVILGTNASGKSSLGIELAKKYDGEIISADSRQIFKGFDLCCGKVTEDEKKIIPHYMLDICNVGDYFSVSDYQKQVYELIPNIYQRKHIPFIVGGTGLYVDSVVKGYVFREEKIDYEYRKMLNDKSVEELQSLLSESSNNYLSNNNSDYNNKRRLVRILEKEANGTEISADYSPKYNALQIGVTWPKELLDQRIDERLQTRIKQGMIDEVSDYLKSGGNPEYLHSLGLEYKYIAYYLEGKYSSIDDFTNELSIAIKHFAKQQMKWFKRNQAIHWIDMTQNPYEESCKLIEAFISK